MITSPTFSTLLLKSLQMHVDILHRLRFDITKVFGSFIRALPTSNNCSRRGFFFLFLEMCTFDKLSHSGRLNWDSGKDLRE